MIFLRWKMVVGFLEEEQIAIASNIADTPWVLPEHNNSVSDHTDNMNINVRNIYPASSYTDIFKDQELQAELNSDELFGSTKSIYDNKSRGQLFRLSTVISRWTQTILHYCCTFSCFRNNANHKTSDGDPNISRPKIDNRRQIFTI